ncbi:MAG: HupE/UreJ family protein [Burkholderiales bacterium]
MGVVVLRGRGLGTCAAALLLAVVSEAAEAHTAAKGVGDFYSGVLHPLTALEHVLPFVALGLLTGQGRAKTGAEAVLAVFPVALMTGAMLAYWLPAIKGLGIVNVGSAILIGLLVAIAWTLPVLVIHAIAALFGLSHGYANGEAIVGSTVEPWVFIPGVGVAGLVVLAYCTLATDYILGKNIGWMKIALRVAGSWIAAIGLLVMATSAKTLLAS